MRTVLVTSGGGFQGLALIKALRAAGPVRIVLLDCYEESVSRYFADAFYLAPRIDPPAPFLEFALDVCRREGVEAVFAATEFELLLLTRHRQDFAAAGAIVYVPDAQLLALTSDKSALYAWLQAEALPCLPWFDSPWAPGATLPLIGKPRHGWGGRDILRLYTEADRATLDRARIASHVWQPLLDDFEEYSVDFAIDVDGNPSPLALRRRVRTSGGFAVVCEPGAPATVRDVAQTTVRRLTSLGARGPMNLQLLHTRDGCWVSDFNPRIGTSMPLSIAAGANPLAWLFGTSALDPRGQPTNTRPRVGRVFRSLIERAVAELDLSGVRGVVFDLDDTLIEQKRWIFDKLALTWTVHRERLPAHEVFMQLGWRIIEEGNRDRLFDALCAELGLDTQMRDTLITTYRQACPSQASVYPDVLPSLEQLQRLGYRLGLLTDNPPASQRMKLEVAGLAARFDAIVYTGELDTRKPNARAFTAIAETMRLPHHALVMVGDNLYRDIQGALSAGFAHSFFVQREGGFFNFRPELASGMGLDLGRCTRIEALHELCWYLTPRATQTVATQHSVA